MYVKKALDMLENCGFSAYVVGGCVRDSLLGKNPSDYDITTSATPTQILECFKGYRCIETGIKHGTIGVLVDGEMLEITTFRIDGNYIDNRHPKNVEFTSSLKEDLARRDFTVNAMAYSEKEGVVDYFGGMFDLENKIIRCVGNAEKRFDEDALRILRALRFSAVLGFEIEDKTRKAAIGKRELLLNISAERIREEFSKLVCAPNGGKIVFEYIRIIGVFLPELLETRWVKQFNEAHIYDVFMHSVKAMVYAPQRLELKLAMLFHDVGKPVCFSLDKDGNGHFYGHQKRSAGITENILKRLRFDNKTIALVSLLVNYHDGKITSETRSVLNWLKKIGKENFELLLEVKRADALAHSEAYADERLKELEKVKKTFEFVLKNNLCYNLKMLNYNGNDAANIGFSGKETGSVLEYLLSAVIGGRCENDKEKLEELAKSYKEKEK